MASYKMRVLYYSKSGKVAALAGEIASKYDVKLDDIPPAYPCENEKLVIIGISVGKEIPNDLRLFLQGFDKSRAKNAAFFVDGSQESAREAMNFIREKGVNVFSKVCYIKGGLPLKFIKGFKPEEKTELLNWAEEIYAEVEKM